MKKIFTETKRVVIKVGSSLLVDSGMIKKSWLQSLIEDITYLLDNGVEVVLTTSGSIALGRSRIGVNNNLTIAQKQAAAAIGQINLMSDLQKIANQYHFQVAQILLCAADFENRERYDNLRNIFQELLRDKIVPVINENDSVSVDEIKIGDNDRLAARAAQICDADLLILFSDIDGLYDKNPNLHKDATFIPYVENITKEIEDMAGQSSSDYGTGGMETKIAAAKMASLSGCKTVIANGKEPNPIARIIDQRSRFTIFDAAKKTVGYRKKWLSGFMQEKSEVIINKNAVNALISGSASLLPVGVVAINGNFKKGDLISVKDENGNHIASGNANYDVMVAKSLIGKKSSDAANLYGEGFRYELIHIDNLILIYS